MERKLEKDAHIGAVVFDFGGVMTTSVMPERLRPLTDSLGISWDVIEKGFARYRCQHDAGFFTLAEMYAKIWADAGLTISSTDLNRIAEVDRSSWLYRNERTLAWMRELKAAGYRIGILTNMSPEFAPLFRRHFADFIELGDALVISGEVGLYKPQHEIYELLRMRICLPASELVFVDDVEANVRGAEAAGWRAIRFVTNEQVERDFWQMVNRDGGN